MIPDLRSNRGESTTSEIVFLPWVLGVPRLTGGTQRTTGLMVRYEVVKVSRLLSRKDLVRNNKPNIMPEGQQAPEAATAVRSWSLRLSSLLDSDLAWVNGKSDR